MPTISAKLYSGEKYKRDQTASLIFELTNHSKSKVHILKWNTPLEGLKSDCLRVTKNGRAVPYDGRLVKRSAPQPKDFISLEPGQSVSAKVDLSESYDLSKATTVKVNFKSDKLIYSAEQPVRQMMFSSLISQVAAKPLNIKSQAASFTISGGGASKPTIAELIRREEAKEISVPRQASFEMKTMAGTPSLKPCKFKGGSDRRMQMVRNAHKNGYELTLGVIGKIEQNNIYQIWFGGFKKSHISKIKSDFTKIKNDFEHQTFTYDLSGDGCDPGDYAFTYPSTKRISLCSSFWLAPATGADSRAGTIVHEHSHHSAGTDDNAYGEEDCKRLAQFNSNKAVRNADSHEFFVGG